jgi:hypothetical protein
MLYKTTKRLFRGIYQYKIVLTCAGAGYFRNADLDNVALQLVDAEAMLKDTRKTPSYKLQHIKTLEDLEYAQGLHLALVKMQDMEIRVESPWITIYSNNKKDIDTLAKIDKSKVKYISQPEANTALAAGTIVMPKMDYDYRVTMGKTNQPNPSFIAWAQTNKKCKLTKSCIRDLEKSRSWGGTHFYITGDNNLLLAKMHLGGCIAKVERIVKN